MALEFICKSVWNKFVHEFLDDYCKNFPQLTHSAQFRDEVGTLLDNDDAKLEHDKIAKLFIKSFQPVVERLKKCDETLRSEGKCTFILWLQLGKIWSGLSKAQKENVWGFLNSAYLLLQIFIITPDLMMKKLETLIRNLYGKVVVRKEEFDKAEFTASAKTLLHDVNNEDISIMTDFFWELITSKYTPIYSLVKDPNWHGRIHTFIQLLKRDSGRKLVMDYLAPVIKDVKTRVGDSGIGYDEEKNEFVYSEELSGDSKEAKEAKRKSQERVLECIIDTVGSILSKRKDLVEKMTSNPTEGMKLMMKEFADIITNFTTGGLYGAGADDSAKVEEDEKKTYGFIKRERKRADADPPKEPSAKSDVPSAKVPAKSDVPSAKKRLVKTIEPFKRY